MVTLNPYPRGFVIFRHDTAPEIPNGWHQLSLGVSGWYFAHDPIIVPEIAWQQESDKWVLVHGLCLHASPDEIAESPATYLVNKVGRGHNEFFNALDYLGGRHLILQGDSNGFRVFNDATGMRSVYYSAGSALLASHINLINDIQPHPPRSDSEGARGAMSGWDRTKYFGIDPLLPNHYLKVDDWSVHRFFPRETNKYADWSLADKIQAFRDIWTVEINNLVATKTKLVMSLTGGADSRTSLALSMAHLQAIEMFTYTVNNPGSSKWAQSMALDKQLVEEIKQLVPVKHRYFLFGKNDLPSTDKINRALAKNTVQNHGQWLVPHYANAFPDDQVVHLRGNAYEIGRAYWGSNATNGTIPELRRLYRSRTNNDHGYESEQSRREDFERGLRKWQYVNGLHGYHRRDLFYWEIRSGRWLAEILNETDVAFETCVPMNVRALVEISLAFSPKERAEGFFFAEIINSIYPILNFPGKNDPRNLYEIHRDHRNQSVKIPSPEELKLLSSILDISRGHDQLDSYTCENNQILIPREHYQPGVVATRTFSTTTKPGQLTFEIESDYYKPEAKDHWHYQIAINGEARIRWDGALQGRSVHVAIGNLSIGDTVAIQAIVLRDQTGRESWETVSRALIQSIQFTPRENDGETWVVADTISLPINESK